MDDCGAQCVHRLTHTWFRDSSSTSPASLLSQLFGKANQTWKGACSVHQASKQPARLLLRESMDIASRLIAGCADGDPMARSEVQATVKELSRFWAVELALAAAQLCVEHRYTNGGDIRPAGKGDLVDALSPVAGERIRHYFSAVQAKDKQVVGSLAMQGEDSVHMLLHLLDESLRYAEPQIDRSFLFRHVVDAIAILASSAELSPPDSELWLALFNFVGAYVSRHTLSEEEKLGAVEASRIGVARIAVFPPDVQCTVIAVIYSMGTTARCDIGLCVADLIHACAVSNKQFLKIQVCEVVSRLLCSGQTLPSSCIEDMYALADDYSDAARSAWKSLLPRVDHRALLPPAHPFSSAMQALEASGCREWCADMARRGSCELSAADAMAVASLLAESCQNEIDSASPYVAEFGFGSTALDVIADLSRMLSSEPQIPDDICSSARQVIASAACRIRSASAEECLTVASSLLKAIRARMTAQRANKVGGGGVTAEAQGGAERAKQPATRGLYWVLEFLFHLGAQSSPASGLLLNSLDTQLLLLEAAIACSNIGFAVYVCQTALRNSADSDGSHIIKRLASVAPWPLVSELLGGESGDAIDLVVSCKRPSQQSSSKGSAAVANAAGDIEAELYALSLASYKSGASDRLGRFDAISELDSAQLPRSADAFSMLQLSGQPAMPLEKLSRAAFLEEHGGDLLFADRFLGQCISRSLLCLAVRPSAPPALSLFRDVVAQRLCSSDTRAELKIEAAAWLSGSGHNQVALDALQSVAVDDLGPGSRRSWWSLFTTNALAKAYASQQPMVVWQGELAEQQSVAPIMDCISASDRADIIFSLPPSAPSSPYVADMAEDQDGVSVGKMVGAGVDMTKALAALLYASQGCLGEATNELYTKLLMEGSGKIRFTATGTLDPAAKLISQMTSKPSSAPQLQTDALNANAIEQIAPFIPQLFSMLCYNESGLQATEPTAATSAYGILELLAKCAPDLVVFYAVVASHSQPKKSRSSRRVARLMRLFDSKQVADIEAFLALAGKIMVLPHERLRWVCTKAKSAYHKAMSAHLKHGASADAVNETLEPIYRLLDEYSGADPQSPAETEFIASIPGLTSHFDRLKLGAGAGKNEEEEAGSRASPERIWADILKALNTQATLPMAYVSPAFAEFRAAVPIPSLTNPTEPLYFAQVGDTVRVIGSKTRPKLLTLHLATRSGALVKEKYILKGSEDLRMDETVIQAFIRLNRVVGGTDGKPHRVPGSCCTKLAVYNVVPTGAFGGLIQVVDNAPSLFYMYSQHASHQMAKQDGKSAVGGGRSESRLPMPPTTQQIYTSHAMRILKSHSIPASTPPHAWPPNVVVEIYDSLAKAVQANILHAQLVRAAQSPGHLYLATKNIVKSIGMASIAGYLLGLGDRHLDNLLVDLQRGQLIPIDFNVCFDFGGISRVPEQVPFRMTPILQYLCGLPDQSAGEGGGGAAAVGERPFAFSKLFFNAASAALLFARMDRDAVVNAIVSRAAFWPFMEWCGIEEAWLKDPGRHGRSQSAADAQLARQQQTNSPAAEDSDAYTAAVDHRGKWASHGSGEMAEQQQQPHHSLAAADPRRRPSVSQSEKLVRTTGLCPLNAFLPYELPSAENRQPVTEVPFGWRIAQAAIGRVNARLEFEGSGSGSDQHAIVDEQVMAVWRAATSKDRLTKMYVGWAPWI